VVSVILTLACVKFEREVDVTPGTVPPEVEGAYWPDTPVSYCIVRGSEPGFVEHDVLVQTTMEAFDAWGIETSYEGECEGRAEQGNGRNEVSWGELGSEGSSSLAKAGNTNIRYRTTPLGGGAPDITEADIILDADPPAGKDSVECLRSTLLHETGHFLGLHHLGGETIMSPVITDCLQEPTQADRDALAELY
jgi:hypothetical protein